MSCGRRIVVAAGGRWRWQPSVDMGSEFVLSDQLAQALYPVGASNFVSIGPTYTTMGLRQRLTGLRPMYSGHGLLDLRVATTGTLSVDSDNYKSLQYRPRLGPKDTETLKGIQPIKGTHRIYRVNILDFCEDILLIIMEKARRDKRKEVQTRLNFGENLKKTQRERENSLNSRAEETSPI
ncbi:hypothetical protein Tco_1447306 [Tanacetum coccineum]